MKPTFVTLIFAAISIPEACTVTQKMDRDQVSERRIRTLKDTDMIKLTLCCNFAIYSLRMTLF